LFPTSAIWLILGDAPLGHLDKDGDAIARKRRHRGLDLDRITPAAEILAFEFLFGFIEHRAVEHPAFRRPTSFRPFSGRPLPGPWWPVILMLSMEGRSSTLTTSTDLRARAARP